jgi:reductive dehalogenase
MNTDFEYLYPVKNNYKRYDSRKTALASKKKDRQDSTDKITSIIKRGLPGFSRLDYTFRKAAMTTAMASDSGRGNLNSGFYSWSTLGVTKKTKETPRWEATPEVATRVMEKAAKYYGASDIGFCRLDRRWVYSHTTDGREIVFERVEEGYLTDRLVAIPESHKWVIAITVPMEFDIVKYAPTALNVMSGLGYSRMAVVAGSLSEFIRGLGYKAIPSGNDIALNVPIAIQAGLGHVGRHGRLITWARGPMVRICKIFTDMPLAPSLLAPEGIIEYCNECKKCATHCPSRAISRGPRTYEGKTEANNSGVLKWYCNADLCAQYWEEIGTSCGICFMVCPFSKKSTFYHKIKKWSIRNIPSFNKLFIKIDNISESGKMADPRKFWEEDE